MRPEFRWVWTILSAGVVLAIVAGPVRSGDDRPTAAATLRKFQRARDETLFQALGPTGQGLRERRKAIQEAACAALDLLGISVQIGSESVTLASGSPLKLEGYGLNDARTVRDGCCELLLVLAESFVEPLPGQTAAEYQVDLRRALSVLAVADRLTPSAAQTRAYHRRKARYRELLHQDGRAEREAAARTPLHGDVDAFLVADDFYRRGNLGRARELFEGVLGRQPDFWCSYFLAVCCLQEASADVRAGRPLLERARGHLTDCLTDAPAEARLWTLLLRGVVSANLENFAAAEEDFQKALDLAQGRNSSVIYALYNNRGVMRIGRGKLDEGIADLTEAVKLRPDRYPAHLSLAQAYELQKRSDESDKKYSQALQVAEQQVKDRELEASVLSQLYRTRGYAHEQALLSGNAARDATTARSYHEAALRYYDHAAEVCERALKEAGPGAPTEASLRQSLAWARFDRGRFYCDQRHAAEAVSEFDAAQRAGADADLIDRLGVLRWRGTALLKLGRNAEAIRAFDQYLGDGSTRWLLTLGGLLALAGDGPIHALPVLGVEPPQRRPDPESAYAYRARAFAETRLENPKAALQDCARALAIEPDNAETYDQRGRLYLTMESYALAEMDFDRAIQLRPGAAAAYVRRGYARVKRGDLAAGVGDADTGVSLARKAEASARPAPGLLWEAARVYAQAVGKRDRALTPEQRGTDLQRNICQEQAVKLVRQALEATAATERTPFWRDHVQADRAFDPIRFETGLADLAKEFSLPGPRREEP